MSGPSLSFNRESFVMGVFAGASGLKIAALALAFFQAPIEGADWHAVRVGRDGANVVQIYGKVADDGALDWRVEDQVFDPAPDPFRCGQATCRAFVRVNGDRIQVDASVVDGRVSWCLADQDWRLVRRPPRTPPIRTADARPEIPPTAEPAPVGDLAAGAVAVPKGGVRADLLDGQTKVEASDPETKATVQKYMAQAPASTKSEAENKPLPDVPDAFEWGKVGSTIALGVSLLVGSGLVFWGAKLAKGG